MSKIPSIAVIPSGYKGGVSGVDGTVYSVLPTNGDADLDFTRNCVATRVNQNGLIEEVGLNVPRLDYSDGGCPSLLLEPQITNLLAFSEDFTQSDWAKTNCAVSSTTNIQPSGINGGYKLTYTSDTGDLFDFVSVSSGVVHTFSAWVKSSQNGVINMSRANQPADGSNINVTTDWQRFEVQITPTSSTDGVAFRRLSASDLDSIEVWGVQLEEGSYATSYIPTNGATATRFKDEASKDNLESYINSSEGVLYAEINVGNIADFSRYLSISDGGTSNRVILGVGGGATKIVSFVSGGGSSINIISSTIDLTQNQKIAVKWKQNEFKLFVNGVLEDSNTTNFSLPTNMDSLNYSAGDSSSSPLYGKTKDLRVYNEALTDAELIELTTI